MNTKILGILFLAVALGIFGVVTYKNSFESQDALVLAPRTMLAGLWHNYKEDFVREGRTVDPHRDFVTTSEGQSYTLLRAVWMDDKETFDQAWKWTRENMKRPDDHLFAWLFGERPDGTNGILVEIGGANTASDADTDIALALVFAYSRWRDASYLNASRDIIQDIWTREVVMIGEEPVLAANNLEKDSSAPILVNPSYFAPYAYRIFSHVDPAHPWSTLVDSSYRIIQESAIATLDTNASAALPPDWVFVDRGTGAVRPASISNLATTYGYEAARLPWRLALDWQWNQESRARETLGMFGFLRGQWESGKRLYATYSHDGRVVGAYEAPVMYAGSLGYFIVAAPEAAKEIYKYKLESLYNSQRFNWKQPLGYYDTNWAWFGLALYNKTLENLSPFPQNFSDESYFIFQS